MKASHYSGPPPHRGSIGATRYSPRYSSPDNIDVKDGVNNYGTASSLFHSTNNAIVYLDALYKTLSSGSQAAWGAAAANMTTAKVCGCPRSNYDGQKLFRVINYQLVLAGLPPILIPPDTTPWSEISTTVFEKQDFQSLTPPIQKIQISTNVVSQSGTIVFHLYGGYFPVNIANGTFFTIITPADIAFAPLWAYPIGRQVKWCSFLITGNPSTAGYARGEYALL